MLATAQSVESSSSNNPESILTEIGAHQPGGSSNILSNSSRLIFESSSIMSARLAHVCRSWPEGDSFPLLRIPSSIGLKLDSLLWA